MVHREPFDNVIDRSLNYGRHLIESYMQGTKDDALHVALDIGAGSGNDLELVRRHFPSAEMHAVEVYPDYQNILKRKNIIVHPLNIEHDSIPFSDGTVDLVIANQILEHTKEIFWILHEVSRVLRVGGKFILGVPNLASFHNRILLAVGRQPSCLQNHSAHVRGYTKQDILKLFEIAFPDGYMLKRFGGSNFYPFPSFIAKPLAALFPNMAWGIFLMFQKKRTYTREFLEHPIRNRLETNFFLGEK